MDPRRESAAVPARECLTQHSAVRSKTTPRVRESTLDPLVLVLRKWCAHRVTVCRTLREGRRCVCSRDVTRSVHLAQKTVSTSRHTHRVTIVHNTHRHSFLPFFLSSFSSHSDSPHTEHSAEGHESHESAERVVHSRFSNLLVLSVRASAALCPRVLRLAAASVDGSYAYVTAVFFFSDRHLLDARR